jgi:hypothetical protein
MITVQNTYDTTTNYNKRFYVFINHKKKKN